MEQTSMEMTAEDLFLSERRTGIGGSDAKHYLGIEPYGCARLCWYQKMGAEPDYPIKGNQDLLDRGHALEPLIVERYTEATGNNVFPCTEIQRHPEFPALMAHVDGFIGSMTDNSGAGVLECKSAGREVFSKMKREGLPKDYVAQMQHYFAVTGATWGAFAVLWPDGWEFLTFPVERDEALVEVLVGEAMALWEAVENEEPPDPLPPKSKQCQRCEYRTSCQGEELLKLAGKDDGAVESEAIDLAPYFEAREFRDAAVENFESEQEFLKEQVGSRSVVDGMGGRIYYRPQTSMRWDAAHLAKSYSALVEFIATSREGLVALWGDDPVPEAIQKLLVKPEDKFKKPSVSRPLRVFAK